jgi:SAM-dependent methyltransferase
MPEKRERIDLERIRQFYNLLPRIYEPDDTWHNTTHEWIRKFITDHHSDVGLTTKSKVLNAGSGGESCTFPEECVYHLDIAERRLPKSDRSFIGDVQNPPFVANFFDVCVCVGSVLNYCDAAAAISSLARVTRNKGFVFLEFETTSSLELASTTAFLSSATLITTFYHQHKVRLWAYSESYVRGLLKAYGFITASESRSHILSPLVYRITRDSQYSARFARFDPLLRRIPLLKRFCSNVIFLCRKL